MFSATNSRFSSPVRGSQIRTGSMNSPLMLDAHVANELPSRVSPIEFISRSGYAWRALANATASEPAARHVCMRRPVCASQTRAPPYPWPQINLLPSGENVMDVAPPSWSANVRATLPVFVSQMRTMPLAEPAASDDPSGANATANTSFAMSVADQAALPVRASHTHTPPLPAAVPPPAATCRPSEDSATAM